jgi:hypothetical protein
VAGQTLSPEETELLRQEDARYVRRRVKITLTEEEVQVYGERARAEGHELAPWLAGLVRLGAQGGFVPRAAHQRLEREAEKLRQDLERVRLEAAEGQIRLAASQRLVAKYQEDFRNFALAVPRGA